MQNISFFQGKNTLYAQKSPMANHRARMRNYIFSKIYEIKLISTANYSAEARVSVSLVTRSTGIL